MHLNLRDQQLKTIMSLYRLLYKNLSVTTNQKSVIDMHTKRKRNPNITLKIVIKSPREENKRRKGRKRSTKINPKYLTKLQ